MENDCPILKVEIHFFMMEVKYYYSHRTVVGGLDYLPFYLIIQSFQE